MGSDVDVHYEESAATTYCHVASAEYGAVERVGTEVAVVVGKEVFCMHLEVVGQACEALVEEAAAYVAYVAVGILEGHSVEFYLVGHERHCVVVKIVTDVERSHHGLGVHSHLARQVDFVQRT